MGWLISLVMLLIGSFSGNDILVITSGIYAIAGAVGNGLLEIAKINNGKTEN